LETSEVENKFKPLDIKQLFMEKNPGMARSIPGFVYAYLTKILHLDSINEFLRNHGEKQGLEFVQAAIDDFNVSLEIIGEWNLPDTGRYIFVSNHPLGGFDGLLLMNIIGKRFSGIKSISNDILINVKNLSDFFLPVNKHGAQTPEIVKNMELVFNSDTQIMSFPAGLVSRRRKGIIRDVPWKKVLLQKPSSITGMSSPFT
jgi:putative hemolysin